MSRPRSTTPIQSLRAALGRLTGRVTPPSGQATPFVVGTVQADGRWDLRLLRPDGELDLRFVAQSPERALIGLGLRIERRTLREAEETARLRVDSDEIDRALQVAVDPDLSSGRRS